METIKEIWYGVRRGDKFESVHESRDYAIEESEKYKGYANVERVRVTIDRIKS